ncbi:MAG: uncharacterized protein A8A55_1291 [Amphiamblys sp. WSBS2006]|nr:MAG: uncharacterized protein A8A55_1291 [Amphiamblys sp. WSBS2006]
MEFVFLFLCLVAVKCASTDSDVVYTIWNTSYVYEVTTVSAVSTIVIPVFQTLEHTDPAYVHFYMTVTRTRTINVDENVTEIEKNTRMVFLTVTKSDFMLLKNIQGAVFLTTTTAVP